MLINGDVKGLEVVCAAELSQDKVLCDEIRNKVDIHGNNQAYFRFPEGKEGRLVAKIFKFRLIYGGSAYAYSVDPEFWLVSKSERYWQGIIEQYYDKYKGLAEWHNHILREARATGKLEIPSGRWFSFTPEVRWNGLKWPDTTIKNYPVQGYGADLVMLARIELMRLIREAGLEREALLVMTIHDSLVLDTPSKNCYTISNLVKQAIESVPRLVKERWGHDFNLPLTCEISVGNNKKDLKELKL